MQVQSRCPMISPNRFFISWPVFWEDFFWRRIESSMTWLGQLSLFAGDVRRRCRLCNRVRRISRQCQQQAKFVSHKSGVSLGGPQLMIVCKTPPILWGRCSAHAALRRPPTYALIGEVRWWQLHRARNGVWLVVENKNAILTIFTSAAFHTSSACTGFACSQNNKGAFMRCKRAIKNSSHFCSTFSFLLYLFFRFHSFSSTPALLFWCYFS